MAIVFDMTSGEIHSENAGVTRIRETHDPADVRPALQTVCETPETGTPREVAMHHIREILKKT